MQDNSSETFLDILKGEKLSSVTFVMDYLQIDFDGNRFTFNIWPVITIDNIDYKFGDTFYRDKLCSLIAKIVSAVTFIENEKMVIKFEKDQLFLSLDPNNKEIVTPEIATFYNISDKLYIF